jgi:hypothetical protein
MYRALATVIVIVIACYHGRTTRRQSHRTIG